MNGSSTLAEELPVGEVVKRNTHASCVWRPLSQCCQQFWHYRMRSRFPADSAVIRRVSRRARRR